jgi:hypothetical protein
MASLLFDGVAGVIIVVAATVADVVSAAAYSQARQQSAG